MNVRQSQLCVLNVLRFQKHYSITSSERSSLVHLTNRPVEEGVVIAQLLQTLSQQLFLNP